MDEALKKLIEHIAQPLGVVPNTLTCWEQGRLVPQGGFRYAHELLMEALQGKQLAGSERDWVQRFTLAAVLWQLSRICNPQATPETETAVSGSSDPISQAPGVVADSPETAKLLDDAATLLSNAFDEFDWAARHGSSLSALSGVSQHYASECAALLKRIAQWREGVR